VGRPPLTLGVCCSSPATMAVRHLGGMSHVDMCAGSGTPALVGAPRAVDMYEL